MPLWLTKCGKFFIGFLADLAMSASSGMELQNFFFFSHEFCLFVGVSHIKSRDGFEPDRHILPELEGSQVIHRFCVTVDLVSIIIH